MLALFLIRSILDLWQVQAHNAHMEIWIIITIAAAFFQNIRSTFQKLLKSSIGTSGATFVRFGFGMPFALLYFFILYRGFGYELPVLGEGFWVWVIIAALSQIAAQVLLILAFSYRNFMVATAYSRMDTAQTALFAMILFSEYLPFGGIMAIAISTIGVILISVARTAITPVSLISSLTSPAALLGLGSGTLFGLAGVAYRAAALAVEHDTFFVQSITTLCVAITLQTLIMLVWITLFERAELIRIAKAWRPALLVGFAGATASFGWFSAFALQHAALVKVVSQIEMLFTFASSAFFFKESINRTEIIGCLLITTGIILLVLV